MKPDEIMHVLRLVALGRINTPQQEEFCEKLAKVFARSEVQAPEAIYRIEPAVDAPLAIIAEPAGPGADVVFADAQPAGGLTEIVVTPKRRKKAE